jgi:hypothetical protein
MLKENVFSVTDYGAVPNSSTYQDIYIQKALDACFFAGGGEVTVPAGTYRVRGLRLRSNTTLHLLEDCILEGSRDPEAYFVLEKDSVEPVDPAEISHNAWLSADDDPAFTFFKTKGSRWNNALIRIYRAHNAAIVGEKGAVIDGRNCYDPNGEEHYRGPHGISAIDCHGLTFSGYTARNTGNWAHCITDCSNVRVDNLTCLAGHDGVHITSCEDVIIKHCGFYTGDDCVAGFNNKNVLVTDCEINTACSAFRFGGTNVLITDCRIFAPAKYFFRGAMTQEEKESGILANDAPSMQEHKRDNMLSVFTYYADHSTVITNPGTNITVRDCEIDGADRFLHFNYSGNETWQNNRPLLDIRFENIRAENICMPMTAYGDKDAPVEVIFENLDFSFRKGFEDTPFMHVANFRQIVLRHVCIRNAHAQQLIKNWSKKGEGAFVFDDLTCDIPQDRLVVHTDEPFICQPI